MPFTLRDIDDYLRDARGPDAVRWQVAPASKYPVEAPAFMLGDLPGEMTYALFGHFELNPVRCYRLRNVRLSVDGIVVAGEYALHSTFFNHPNYHVSAVLDALPGGLDAMPVRNIPGQAVMFSGPGSHIYGHWLVDIMPRLFVLDACGFDIRTLRYCVPTSLPAYCRDFLRLLGIGQEQLVFYEERKELIEVEDLLLPSNLRTGSRLHPAMMMAKNFLRDSILATSTRVWGHARPTRRIFLSREGTDPSRTLENRPEIEQIAAAQGLEIVRPQNLGLVEQIELFTEASLVVGEYGSALHSTIFSASGTVVMAMRGTSHHPGFIQSGIGQTLHQPTGYVFGSTPVQAVDQSFPITPDAFRLGLRCAELLVEQAARLRY